MELDVATAGSPALLLAHSRAIGMAVLSPPRQGLTFDSGALVSSGTEEVPKPHPGTEGHRVPDHLKGLLLLVGAAKEEERQDRNRQPDGSSYENPLLLVFRTPALCLMAMLLFKAVGVELVLALVVRVRDLEGFGRYFGFLVDTATRVVSSSRALDTNSTRTRRSGGCSSLLAGRLPVSSLTQVHLAVSVSTADQDSSAHCSDGPRHGLRRNTNNDIPAVRRLPDPGHGTGCHLSPSASRFR